MTQNITLINADVIDGLKSIDKNSIDTIITSPPYSTVKLNLTCEVWGLRDYGIDGQLGMESTLEEYINKLLNVTKELKRVLKPTGVIFWNHGDSYPSGGGKAMESSFNRKSGIDTKAQPDNRPSAKLRSQKGKCLMMQDARLIIKMIDDQDWILRNRNIWYKTNGMPSSAPDRFTNKYEHVYMLTKQKKYNFDLDAVRIPVKYQEVWSRKGSAKGTPYEETGNNPRSRWGLTQKEIKSGIQSESFKMKNPGDVWTIPTQPHKDAHFAIFPDKLPEIMIKAGCPKDGIVLDPFAGSGTTMKVAKELGRSAIGIELSAEYCEIIKRNLLFHQYTFGNIVNEFVKL